MRVKGRRCVKDQECERPGCREERWVGERSGPWNVNARSIFHPCAQPCWRQIPLSNIVHVDDTRDGKAESYPITLVSASRNFELMAESQRDRVELAEILRSLVGSDTGSLLKQVSVQRIVTAGVYELIVGTESGASWTVTRYFPVDPTLTP